MGATSAGCTGCGATARVDEGAQRAPHPNGLSVEEGGGGAGVGWWLSGLQGSPTTALECMGLWWPRRL